MNSVCIVAALLVSAPAFADGASDYAMMCATCHGAGGAGDGVAAAGLPVKPADFTDPAFWSSRDDATVTKAIKEGGMAIGKSAMMAPFGSSLSDEKIADIVKYLKTLKK